MKQQDATADEAKRRVGVEAAGQVRDGMVVGLGTGSTAAWLVKCLGEVLGRKLAVVHKPLPSDDPVRRRPDTSRAQERLGWTPGVSLMDGMAKTVEYFKSALGM